MESVKRSGAAGAAVAPLRVVAAPAAAADGTKVRRPSSFGRNYGAWGREWVCSLGQRSLSALNQAVRRARPRSFVHSLARPLRSSFGFTSSLS